MTGDDVRQPQSSLSEIFTTKKDTGNPHMWHVGM